jgi:hypothetical protein
VHLRIPCCRIPTPAKANNPNGLSVEWWAASGYCTRFAPAPTGEDKREVDWGVTHAGDGCGDGDQVEMLEQLDSGMR